MAIIDVENQIDQEKEKLRIASDMRDAISKIDDSGFKKGIFEQIEKEITERKKEIDRLEFSIVNERKNCTVCIWSEVMGEVILCTNFASKHNGEYVQKNYANKCKQFHKTDGFFERR